MLAHQHWTHFVHRFWVRILHTSRISSVNDLRVLMLTFSWIGTRLKAFDWWFSDDHLLSYARDRSDYLEYNDMSKSTLLDYAWAIPVNRHSQKLFASYSWVDEPSHILRFIYKNAILFQWRIASKAPLDKNNLFLTSISNITLLLLIFMPR